MATVAKETQVNELKQTELVIQEVEDFAVIVNIKGWRMRVYYDVDFKNEKLRSSQLIKVNYYGDIEDPFSIQFEKLK